MVRNWSCIQLLDCNKPFNCLYKYIRQIQQAHQLPDMIDNWIYDISVTPTAYIATEPWG